MSTPSHVVQAAPRPNPVPEIGAEPTTPWARALKSVSALDAAERPRHRWYFFKEAFSPELVQCAVKDVGCGVGDIVFDPFCGSGTVPLQVVLDGGRAEGVEVNPFLSFVARAKLRQCDPDEVRALGDDARRRARRGRRSPLEGYSTFTKRRGTKKWLFNVPVLRAFEAAWHGIADERRSAHEVLRLCLIGAAMDCSNAFKDGKCLRYRFEWREQGFDEASFVGRLDERLSAVVEDLRLLPIPKQSHSIKCADVRQLLRQATPPGKFKLCVTSPPYLNSFDYSDIYRPELFLGKWVSTTADLRGIRFKTVRSHVQVDWPRPKIDSFGERYAEAIRRLATIDDTLWCRRLPLMVQAYFEDMKGVLVGLRARAADSACAWIVVSTSSYGGVEIPVDLIIAEIAMHAGWKVREVSVLRYLGRLAGQQWEALRSTKADKPHLRESVIILDAV